MKNRKRLTNSYNTISFGPFRYEKSSVEYVDSSEVNASGGESIFPAQFPNISSKYLVLFASILIAVLLLPLVEVEVLQAVLAILEILRYLR